MCYEYILEHRPSAAAKVLAMHEKMARNAEIQQDAYKYRAPSSVSTVRTVHKKEKNGSFDTTVIKKVYNATGKTLGTVQRWSEPPLLPAVRRALRQEKLASLIPDREPDFLEEFESDDEVKPNYECFFG